MWKLTTNYESGIIMSYYFFGTSEADRKLPINYESGRINVMRNCEVLFVLRELAGSCHMRS